MRFGFTPEQVFGADFETDNDGITAWMCQFSVSDGTTEWFGRSIYEYRNILLSLVVEHTAIIIYFHNLKYDLQFQKGLLHQFETEGWTPKYILRQGSPVKIRLTQGDRMIELRDSLKKIPSDLKGIGKMIGLDKQESPRGFYQGWSKDIDYSTTSPDWCYVRIDSRIVAQAMRAYHERGFNRATMSSDAWNCMHMMIGSSDGKQHGRYLKWEKKYPTPTKERDRIYRQAYSGGVNYSDNKGLNSAKDLQIWHEDVHNMYGGVMFNDPLPYGVGVHSFVRPREGRLWIQRVRLKLKLREGLRPWYQFRNAIDNIIEGWEHGALVTETAQWHDLTLCCVDIQTLEKWYEVEYDPDYPVEYWHFKSEIGALKPYLDQFTAIKESSKKGSVDYISAKTMINAAYGRFGLALDGDETLLEWDEDLGDYAFKSHYIDDSEMDGYIPFAVFVTAWARRHLTDNLYAIMKEYGPDAALHCDTDSVIHYGDPVETPATPHGEHVGTWGIESQPNFVLESGFKRYMEFSRYPMESMDDLVGMACAGVPQKWDYDHRYPVGMWVELLDDPEMMLQDGHELGQAEYRIKSGWLRRLYINNGADPDKVDTRKLIPKAVPGGVILEPRTHKLNDNLIWRLRR